MNKQIISKGILVAVEQLLMNETYWSLIAIKNALDTNDSDKYDQYVIDLSNSIKDSNFMKIQGQLKQDILDHAELLKQPKQITGYFNLNGMVHVATFNF